MSLTRQLLTLLCVARLLILSSNGIAENDVSAQLPTVVGQESVHDDKSKLNVEEPWRGRRRGPSPSTIFNEASAECFEKFYKPTPGGQSKPKPTNEEPGAVSALKERKSKALEDCLNAAIANIALITRKATVSCGCKPVPVVQDSTNIPGDGVIERK